jgi:hypothetical protein
MVPVRNDLNLPISCNGTGPAYITKMKKTVLTQSASFCSSIRGARLLLLTFLLGLLISNGVYGADIYVSQLGSGTTNSIGWLNSSYKWTPGDTIHLVGVITNGLLIGGSGAPGQPITIRFESNAKFSAPTWTTANAPANSGNRASIINGYNPVSYIIIDGGSNGTIEATDNGMYHSYSNNFNAVSIVAGNSLEIKNLTITNLYYRIASQDCSAAPQAITTGGDSFTNLSIHNNTLDMLANGIVVGYNGNCNGLQIYSNTMTRINWGMFLNGGNYGSCSNFSIYGNHINHFENWNPMGGPCAGSYHGDGIYLNNSITGNATTNFNCRVFGNTIGPSVDVASALIYVTGGNAYTFPGLRIYNNLLLEGTNTEQVNSAIAVNTYNVIVVNNTIHADIHQGSAIGVSDGAICTGNLVYNLGIGSTVAFYDGYMEKGILTNFPGYIIAADYTPGLQQWAVYINPSNVVSVLDSNLYSTVDSFELYCPSTKELSNGIADGLNYSTDFIYAQAKWQSFGLDLHSLFTTTKPLFNPDYSLAGSSIGVAFAPNLTWLGITNDFYGNARPTTGNWTAGAFEVSSSTATNRPSAPTAHPIVPQ